MSSSSQHVPIGTHPTPSHMMSTPHSDFLGTSSPNVRYHPEDPLEGVGVIALPVHEDYSFTLEDASGYPTELLDSAPTSTDYQPNLSSWSMSSQHPQGSMLFSGNTYPAALHDSYYLSDPLYGAPPASRQVPRIMTTMSTSLSPSSASVRHGSTSPWATSPASMLHTYGHSSPSSVGSAAPPYTPDTPCTSISPRPSPHINQQSASPISPSHITTPASPYSLMCVPPLSSGSSQESLSIPVTPFQQQQQPQQQQQQQQQPQQQQQEAYGVIDIARTVGHPYGGKFVPQLTYRPHTLSDRRRYVEEVALEPPIMFYCHGPQGCGIPLEDAMKARFSKLEGRDDSMFEGRGPSVSIRLNWPGYAPWSRQIPTRDFRSPPHPITRAKLAKNVAKTINRFIQEMDGQRQEDSASAEWRVRMSGVQGIRLEDLMLVGLQHVSMGSWQAHVRLIRRH